jgi:hypothetical protein
MIFRTSVITTDILHLVNWEFFVGVGAGLFNLFANFKILGESAPTD